MKRLNLIDAMFLFGESRKSPAHIGALYLYDLPADYAGNSFFHEFQASVGGDIVPPFNQKLRNPHASLFNWPAWVEDEHFDFDYHVRHMALPRPGEMAELLKLVSRVHAMPLDRSRPLWECYFIDGLNEGKQLAMYMKVHHACIDGVGGMRLLEQTLSNSPDKNLGIAPWQMKTESRGKIESKINRRKTISQLLGEQLNTIPQLVNTANQLQRRARGREISSAARPFNAPVATFNHTISAQRRFAVCELPRDAVRAIGKAAGGTLNDAMLTICGGALRNYLRECGELPDKTLTASVPMSIRKAHENGGGNRIAVILAALGTDIDDHGRRLAAVIEATKAAKQDASTLTSAAFVNYTALLGGAHLVGAQINRVLNNLAPPVANIVVSNVPGPRKTLYLNGAPLRSMYPMSVLMDGQGLNITIMSYEGKLMIGLMGCRQLVPEVELLANQIEDVFNKMREQCL